MLLTLQIEEYYYYYYYYLRDFSPVCDEHFGGLKIPLHLTSKQRQNWKINWKKHLFNSHLRHAQQNHSILSLVFELNLKCIQFVSSLIPLYLVSLNRLTHLFHTSYSHTNNPQKKTSKKTSASTPSPLSLSLSLSNCICAQGL